MLNKIPSTPLSASLDLSPFYVDSNFRRNKSLILWDDCGILGFKLGFKYTRCKYSMHFVQKFMTVN